MKLDRADILPSLGMAVAAEVTTGTRRLIEFLLSPVIRHVNESGRERLRNITRARLCWCVLLANLSLVGCDQFKSRANLTWREPVTLASGEVTEIERHVVMIRERAFGGGYSSAPIYRVSSLRILNQPTEIPLWEAPLMPLVLERDPANAEWIIVASIDGCTFWHQNGMPSPPYWAFRLRDGEWFRAPLPDFLLGRPTNLLVEFGVLDASKALEATIASRKESQRLAPRHAAQYSKVDATFQSFQLHCGTAVRVGGEPAGAGEPDLVKFRRLQ